MRISSSYEKKKKKIANKISEECGCRCHEITIRSSMIVHDWRAFTRFTRSHRARILERESGGGRKVCHRGVVEGGDRRFSAAFRRARATTERETSGIGIFGGLGAHATSAALEAGCNLLLSLSLPLSPDRGIPSRDVRINRFAASL